MSRIGGTSSSRREASYYAGLADKNFGQTIEVDPSKFAYTRHEPIGVVGQMCAPFRP